MNNERDINACRISQVERYLELAKSALNTDCQHTYANGGVPEIDDRVERFDGKQGIVISVEHNGPGYVNWLPDDRKELHTGMTTAYAYCSDLTYLSKASLQGCTCAGGSAGRLNAFGCPIHGNA